MERLNECIFPAVTESINAARSFVRQLVEPTAHVRRVDDIVLAASELASNAVEHGVGEQFQVAIDSIDDRFLLMVTSEYLGTGVADTSRWTTPGVDATSGRGLALVRMVSNDVWVSEVEDRITIGCSFSTTIN